MNIEKIVSDIEGIRVDKFVSDKLDISRSRVQQLLENGFITIDGKAAKSSQKININQVVMVEIPEAQPVEIVAEDIKLDILYEDNDVIVINKPKGMVVHPANGNYTGTLVNAIMEHCKDNLSGMIKCKPIKKASTTIVVNIAWIIPIIIACFPIFFN